MIPPGLESSTQFYEILLYDAVCGQHMYSLIQNFCKSETIGSKIYYSMLLFIAYPVFWYYFVRPKIRENERASAQKLMRK